LSPRRKTPIKWPLYPQTQTRLPFSLPSTYKKNMARVQWYGMSPLRLKAAK
jgi:hypothetical protein